MARLAGVLAIFLFLSSCTVNNTEEAPDLQQYFDEHDVQGTFGMFNNATGKFTIYNLARFRDSAYLPASTFKIVNALVGIETGRVKDSSTVIAWDGVVRDNPAWNRDLTMQDAFRNSAVPWFQELARRIGKDTMQQWLDTLGYGARWEKAVIGNNLDTFWLDNSVKVTADEQLGLVKRLYFGQLPFQPRSQRIVKNMMLHEENTAYSISYKSGWGITGEKHHLGWMVGWIEENRHPHLFVLQIESARPNFDMRAVRAKMLDDILRHYGFMEGKR